MQYEMKFGTLSPNSSVAHDSANRAFRIAILGDFSGRANQGELAVGPELAARKPVRVDVDNLEQVISRFGISINLPMAETGASVQVAIQSMEDFHPDALFDKLEMFSKLAGLRKMLNDPSSFEKAAKVIQSWPEYVPDETPVTRSRPRGAVVPIDGKLSDFARLVGRPTTERIHTPVNDLVKRIVCAHVVPGPDPRQDQMVAAVDQALSDSMRQVLHHPDFQSLESLWRGVELLTRRIETAADLQLVLYDLTAEELAADLSRVDHLEESGLYQALIEQPSLDAQQGPISVILGQYTFEQTPPHAELLGRIAKLAAAANAPFLAAIGSDVVRIKKPEEIHPWVTEAWTKLSELPESAYLGLTVPRFMLRWPYGKKTEPIERFAFEEFTANRGLKSMLWSNSSIVPGLLLGTMFRDDGLAGMKLGSMMTIDDLPFYYYVDSDGDQTALPCTERLISERVAMHLVKQHLMPILAMQGRAEIRLGSFQSLAGRPLAGPWAPISIASTPGLPQMTEPVKSSPIRPADPEPAGAAIADSPVAPDDELDAMLASLGDLDAPAPTDEAVSMASAVATPPKTSPESDDASEMDALLAELAGSSDESADGDDMDPELAALLADL